jgi:MFS family permease
MVGLIEGVGEATASICKLFSGWLSDRLGERKALAVLGYGLAALSKPLFAIAPTALFVLAARFSDRIGKGVRDAPRDALIGDLVRKGQRGAAYGLRLSMDTIGGFAGARYSPSG